MNSRVRFHPSVQQKSAKESGVTSWLFTRLSKLLGCDVEENINSANVKNLKQDRLNKHGGQVNNMPKLLRFIKQQGQGNRRDDRAAVREALIKNELYKYQIRCR